MCHVGQFEANKQTLCIGLDMKTLKAVNIFRCYLGTNRKTAYEIESIEALTLASKYSSIWTNPKGRQVAILPLKHFKTLVSGWDKEKYEEKEIQRAKINEQFNSVSGPMEDRIREVADEVRGELTDEFLEENA